MAGHVAGAVALAERLPGLLPDLDPATAGLPKGMASHVTKRRDETDDDYAARLDLHCAQVLAARVRIDWLK